MFRMMTSATVPINESPNWFMLNTYLQKFCQQDIHLDIPMGFHEYYEYLEEDSIDLVYATAHDASTLVNEKGFVPVASPVNLRDEVVVVARAGSNLREIYDLTEGCRIAITEDKDINLLGMIMLEPANLDKSNVNFIEVDNWTLVANAVRKNEADIGFILEKSYNAFSADLHDDMQVMVRSEIGVIHHCLMAKPEALEKMPHLEQFFTTLHTSDHGKALLEKLGITKWAPSTKGQMSFLGDILKTLK